tara:strand:+ start:737 stop:895 length:159 start_codon:yes stop_codon:yes gene_type:complete
LKFKKEQYKVCPICNKNFNWRKKWKLNWEDVKYCSERCRRNKKIKLKKYSLL